MHVDVVIVTHESAGQVGRCLESLSADRDVIGQVCVIDNASHDGTAGVVAATDADVQLVALDRNAGFAAAANTGLRLSHASQVLLLNPDCFLAPGTLAHLMDVLEAHPRVGMCGPALVRPDGTPDHAARRSFPTILGAIAHFARVGRWSHAPAALAQYRAPERIGPGPVDAINGAFMLMRRAALDEVGLFDEGYWLYMEDLDLCWRFREQNWLVWYDPTVAATHVKGASTGRHRPSRQNRAFHAGMLRFYSRHYARDRHFAVNAAVHAGVWLKLLGSLAWSAVARARERPRPQ